LTLIIYYIYLFQLTLDNMLSFASISEDN